MHAARVLPIALALLLPAAGARAQSPLPLPARTSLFASLPPRPVAQISALVASGLGPGQQCRAAIRTAERAAGIPNQLMAAIGRVESGRREADGSINPWPWSINAEGEDHVFETKAEAIAAVKTLQAQGMRSIDVGCMQVNLLHHPDAFASLEQAFDPVANASYAARFLVQLHDETGGWPTATAWYHSATPELGADYARRVMAVWPEEQQRPDAAAPQPLPLLASNYANGYTGGFRGGFTGGFASGYTSGFGGPNGPVHAGGNVLFSPRAEPAHIIPLPAGAVGRSLAAYRASPIPAVAPPPPALAPARGIGKPG